MKVSEVAPEARIFRRLQSEAVLKVEFTHENGYGQEYEVKAFVAVKDDDFEIEQVDTGATSHHDLKVIDEKIQELARDFWENKA